jgi:hypothetical protein
MSIYRQYCPETGFYFDYDTNGHICLGISKTYYCSVCTENKFDFYEGETCWDCHIQQQKDESIKHKTALDELYPPEPFKPTEDLRSHSRFLADPH